MSAIDRLLPLPLIRAAEWNAMLDRVERRLNLSTAATPPDRGYVHPWQVRGRWSGELGGWQVRISRGHANAAEVEAPRMPRGRAPEATRARIPRGDMVRPWLSERPWMEVPRDRLRGIGSDAAALESPEPIPPYFAERGVGEGPTLRVDEIGGIAVTPATVPDPRRLRRLRACDLVLTVPKPTVRPEIEVDARGTVRVRPVLHLATGAPSVRLVRRFVPAEDSASLEAQLKGGESDAPVFERLVATLYFLSPPGAPSGAEPDGGWTFHAEHALFWDFFWAWQAEIHDFPEQPLSFNFGLAGGAAQGIVDAMVDDLNRNHAEAAAALKRSAVRIADWTL